MIKLYLHCVKVNNNIGLSVTSHFEADCGIVIYWLADAYGIQVNTSASGFFGEAGFSARVAMDSRGIAPFVSAGIGLGIAPPGIDFSLQFTMSERMNSLIPHKNLGFVKGRKMDQALASVPC